MSSPTQTSLLSSWFNSMAHLCWDWPAIASASGFEGLIWWLSDVYSLNLVFITIAETFGLHEQAKTDPVSCPILLSTANLPPATCSQLIRIKVAAVHTHTHLFHYRDTQGTVQKTSHSCRWGFQRETGNNEVNQRVDNLIATSDKYHEGNKQDIKEENVYERWTRKGLLAFLVFCLYRFFFFIVFLAHFWY